MKRRKKLSPWVHTVGADWSEHSLATRRNVEDLLEYLTHPEPHHRDFSAAPIAQYKARRRWKRTR